MPVTLADIAEVTGLSTSTVSRALSVPEKVNAETRERVLRAAAELGYMPNHTARSLISGHSEMIGLILPDIANPFFPPIIKTVQNSARRRGLTVLIADADEQVSDEIRMAREMRARVDGLIVVSPRTPMEKLHHIAALKPVVFVNRTVPSAASVIVDSREGIEQAVDHLAALGHQVIAYLNGPRRSWSNARRLEAIREACADRGLELLELGPFEPQIQAGVRAADLTLATAATAVVAYDDLIALGFMTRLNERGLSAGRDISVIGVDGSPMWGMAYPSLTSIHVPGAEAGRVAVDLLLDLIHSQEGEPAPTVQLDSHLVVRNSTGVMRPRNS